MKLRDEWKGEETLNLILKKFNKEIQEVEKEICNENEFPEDFL